jgi:hypothetical protein
MISCIEQGKPLNSLGCLDQIFHKLGLSHGIFLPISPILQTDCTLLALAI